MIFFEIGAEVRLPDFTVVPPVGSFTVKLSHPSKDSNLEWR